MTELNPSSAKRRSPVYRQFAGAEYRLVAGQPQAFSIKGTAPLAALYDFSLMPRFGLRGAGAVSYLRDRQFSLPDAVNMAVASDDGSWVARLGKTEYWVLGATSESSYPDRMHGLAEPGSDCYPVPCDEGRAWFVLHNPQKAAVMAKLCGVDLREKNFPLGSVAQTSVARVNSVIINHTLFGKSVYSIFSDVASANYLLLALDDACKEFDAGIAGLEQILEP